MTSEPKSPNAEAGQGPPADIPSVSEADTPAVAEPRSSEANEASPPEPLQARIAKLEEESAAANDRWLRAVAEMENMRKRAEREKSETAKYAITRFAQDVVTVGDNFQRAIAAVPSGAAEKDAALKSLIDGVAVTEREFFNVLERHGVKRIDPQGEVFNPHLHQAVMEQMNAELPAGRVLQVLQAGYVIEDRVLRPAMVVVAKGGPKPAKQPETDGQGAGVPGDQTNGADQAASSGGDAPNKDEA